MTIALLGSAPLQTDLQKSNSKLASLAEDFETTFLASMFGQMTSLLDGDGPLGGQGAGGDTWRALLTDELAKSVSRSGGVGIARSVHAELIALQASGNTHNDTAD